MRIVCLQHHRLEGPAGIERWARSRGHDFRCSHLYAGDGLPAAGEFDWLVVMGGSMGVHDESSVPWLASEKDFIRACAGSGKAVLGVCLGAQLLADALGAEVHGNGEPEIGWLPVTLTDEGKSSAVFAEFPPVFPALSWHGDTFEIASGAERLAYSAVTRNQAFQAEGGRLLGVQFHLELTNEEAAGWAEEWGHQLAAGGANVQSAERITGDEVASGEAAELLRRMLDRMESVISGER